MKILKVLSTAIVMSAAVMMSNAAYAGERETGRGTGPVVYVSSQNLFYDSIVVADLPMKGDFQQLTMGKNGLTTEFGPGTVGHLGGRWWLDLNGDGEMNKGDKFFLCPLLGPGRETL